MEDKPALSLHLELPTKKTEIPTTFDSQFHSFFLIMKIFLLCLSLSLASSILIEKEGNRLYGSPGGILRSVYIRNLISRMIEPYQPYEYPLPYYPHIKMPSGGFRFPSQYRPPFVYESEDPRIPILISSSLTPGSPGLDPRKKLEPTPITITQTTAVPLPSSPAPTIQAPIQPIASPSTQQIYPALLTPVIPPVPKAPKAPTALAPKRQGAFHLLTTAREPQLKKPVEIPKTESTPVVSQQGDEGRKVEAAVEQREELRRKKQPIQFPLIFPPGFGMYQHGFGHFHPENSPVSFVYKVERLPPVFMPPYTPHVYLILNNQPSLTKEPFGQITDLWPTEKKPTMNEKEVQIVGKNKIVQNIEPLNNEEKGKSEVLVFDEVKDYTEKEAVGVVEEVTEVFLPTREETEKSSWDDNSALYVEEFGTTITSPNNGQ